jgi:ribosomal protein S18 acetylase RimI-like enzyme
VIVRRAEPTDALAVATVHVRSWQVGYRGLLPDHVLDRLRPEDRTSHYTFGRDVDDPTTVLALEDDVVVGFATFGASRDGGADDAGELLALYVDPAWWNRGVGRHLISTVRDRLSERGFGSALLWVLAGNERAQRFYRADGWRTEGSRRRHPVWGIEVDEIRYRRGLP